MLFRFIYRCKSQAEKDLPSPKDLEVAFVLADEDKSGARGRTFECINNNWLPFYILCVCVCA